MNESVFSSVNELLPMSFGIRDYLIQAVQSLVEFCPHGFDLNLIASLFGAVSTLI
jgi:hypothetical protein